MRDCIRTKEFAKQCTSLVDVQTTNVQIQKDVDRTSRMSENFSKSLMNMNTRVGGVETAIGGKVDKSDFNNIEAMVTRLELFNEFKDETTSSIAQLQSFEQRTQLQFQDCSNTFSAIDKAQDKMAYDVSKTASKKDTHLLAKEIQAQRETIATLATIEEMQQVWCVPFIVRSCHS